MNFVYELNGVTMICTGKSMHLFLQVSEMLLLGSSNFNYYWGPSRATDFIWNCFSTLEFFFWSFCVLQFNWSGKQTVNLQSLFIFKRLINIYKFYRKILKSVVLFLFLHSLPPFTLFHRFNEMCLDQHYNIDFFWDSLDT